MKGDMMGNRNVMIDQVALKKAIWGKRNEIAQMLGVTPTSLSRKIHGDQTMSVDEFISIAHYLNIDIRRLAQLPP
jgi:transcriptional regulator with XRE-family HTH domain